MARWPLLTLPISMLTAISMPSSATRMGTPFTSRTLDRLHLRPLQQPPPIPSASPMLAPMSVLPSPILMLTAISMPSSATRMGTPFTSRTLDRLHLRPLQQPPPIPSASPMLAPMSVLPSPILMVMAISMPSSATRMATPFTSRTLDHLRLRPLQQPPPIPSVSPMLATGQRRPSPISMAMAMSMPSSPT